MAFARRKRIKDEVELVARKKAAPAKIGCWRIPGRPVGKGEATSGRLPSPKSDRRPFLLRSFFQTGEGAAAEEEGFGQAGQRKPGFIA